MDATARIQLCFVLIILAGVGCIMGGPALDVIHPHFQLDHVLGPAELKDEATLHQTLEILERSSPRRDWPFWMLLGLGLVTLGGVGLHATSRLNRNSPA
jgi:hypothetical protein